MTGQPINPYTHQQKVWGGYEISRVGHCGPRYVRYAPTRREADALVRQLNDDLCRAQQGVADPTSVNSQRRAAKKAARKARKAAERLAAAS